MIELSVICGLCILAWAATTVFLVRHARDERLELEDRIMVLTRPEAGILHKAQRDPEPARVTYMDEEREARIGRSQATLEDDGS